MQVSAEQQLKKEIGFTVALALVVGTVIGSGVFVAPGAVLKEAGSSSMALLAWLLAGLLTMAGGLTIAEVSTQIFKTGGLYVYLEEVYGKTVGYLSGWMQTVIYSPAVIGALGLYMGSLVAGLFKWSEQWNIWIGIGTVVFLAVVNSLGTRFGGILQTVLTVAKLIPIALIVVFGIWQGEAPVLGGESGFSGGGNLGGAILACLFAYDGWIIVGTVAGEMKNPAKLLPKVIFAGLALATAVYLLVNVALFDVLSPEKVATLGANAGGSAAEILFGEIGGKLITVGIIVSIFATLNGMILGSSRIPFAMAERGQLPFSKFLSRVHPISRVPVVAIACQVMIAIGLMLVSNPDKLAQISVFAIFIFYILAFFAVFILRRRNRGIKRPYNVPLYPWIPVLAILGSSFVVVSTLLTQPRDSLMAIGIMVIGLPILWWLERKNKH
ncbi:serine/threonine exchange transporter, LAT family [Marininema mesophilum]|uniref:Serine/threonine exchange transporter, LAT family n=1 Tax=Marininema mesophilum TaxID=1048340 RepID=A0A1H2Y0T4_9BACL|nr:amino acid permease [Marininema mesophilum]SDW98199.1 serine/threonine exchange transporter, LAT family [Marininema mesophilum]